MLGDGYKPDWLYKALPYLYLLSGLVIMWLATHPAAEISGISLISAGMIVWLRRKPYRRVAPAKSPEISRAPQLRKESHPIPQHIGWRASYETGNELIDREHRRLFEISNDLLNALTAQKPQGDIELMIDELITEIEAHFHTEENLLVQLSAKHFKRHRQLHQAMLERIHALRAGLQRGESSSSEVCGFLTHDIVAQHILTEDQLPA